MHLQKGYVNITIYNIIQGVLENLNLNITNLKVTSKTNIKFENLLFKRQSTVHEVLSMFYRCFTHDLYLLYMYNNSKYAKFGID